LKRLTVGESCRTLHLCSEWSACHVKDCIQVICSTVFSTSRMSLKDLSDSRAQAWYQCCILPESHFTGLGSAPEAGCKVSASGASRCSEDFRVRHRDPREPLNKQDLCTSLDRAAAKGGRPLPTKAADAPRPRRAAVRHRHPYTAWETVAGALPSSVLRLRKSRRSAGVICAPCSHQVPPYRPHRLFRNVRAAHPFRTGRQERRYLLWREPMTSFHHNHSSCRMRSGSSVLGNSSTRQ
jgi:hypothetical protein